MMIKIILVSLAIISLAILGYYGSFYFRDTEVNEKAPDSMLNQVESGFPEIIGFPGTNLYGEFKEVDRFHKGSGQATLSRRGVSGQELILRFEDFQVTNGPDLYVYLIKNDSPTHDDSSLGDFISLGRLKGNIGDQNYEFKASDFPDKNLGEYDTAIVWCKQFGTLFTYANLKSLQ